jgi:nicotinate-nucleotide pyrophosphorylase (carboxylating)
MKLRNVNLLPLPEAFARLVRFPELHALIESAKREDMGTAGDITSAALVPADAVATAQISARKAGILCGIPLLPLIAAAYDTRLEVAVPLPDGARLAPGDIIAELRGPLRSVLSAERVVLNFLTHLSGIATATARYVEAIAGTRAKIYDTRKTVPGLRGLQKYAVRCGGGFCHRIGLYDAVLVKDNHIAHIPASFLGAQLETAINAARRLDPRPDFVEVEVDTLQQLRVVLSCDVDVVLLDNMGLDQMREAVAIRGKVNPGVQLEASGGVNLDSVRAIAETGVERIAVGAITHSAPALDIGLDIAP